jgi:hypothetical protein
MVERGSLPILGCVASSAVLPELPGMEVIRGVAREAILRRAFEHPSLVTGRAAHLEVFPGEWERRTRVIKRNVLPIFRVVAGSAVLSELAGMGIILGVTGEAVLRRSLQVSQAAGLDMAVGACRLAVLAEQGKLGLVMFESDAKTILAIVTFQAGRPEVAPVNLHGRAIQPGMAELTDCRIELGNFKGMAIGAGEGRTIFHFLMRQKGITGRVAMRKGIDIQYGEQGLSSTVIRMAVQARHFMPLGQHDTMEILRILQQLGMAH